MLTRFLNYLLDNPLEGLRTSPFRAPPRTWLPIPLFALYALGAGFGGGVLRLEPVVSDWAVFLAISLFFSPAVLEELVFRGLLIPRRIGQHGRRATARAIGWSTFLYVASHPLGALTTSPGAADYFLDPVFLTIVTALGLSCAYAYVVSRSLWCPVLIHWLAVITWVFLLGGYEVVLALEGHAWRAPGGTGPTESG
ncbi:CPBP family glutamic-type intramembrane protease [Gilvimarinus sp. F26214L]|uniref:CPBP family glutamic-type intramembrane protease n=1 Tax=Gilvimarinus sp. DZF01 TaxID=3461371 RepID=UPI0040453324